MKNPNHVTNAFVAALLLAAIAMGCASTANKEGTGEYIDDSVVTTKVLSAIFSGRNQCGNLQRGGAIEWLCQLQGEHRQGQQGGQRGGWRHLGEK